MWANLLNSIPRHLASIFAVSIIAAGMENLHVVLNEWMNKWVWIIMKALQVGEAGKRFNDDCVNACRAARVRNNRRSADCWKGPIQAQRWALIHLSWCWCSFQGRYSFLGFKQTAVYPYNKLQLSPFFSCGTDDNGWYWSVFDIACGQSRSDGCASPRK